MSHKHHLTAISHFFGKFISQSECSMHKLCIEQVPIFSYLNDEEKMDVSNVAQSKSYQKGEIIFSSGEPSENLYIIHKGKVKVSRLSISGKEQILRILEPGDFTGEISLFGHSPHKSSGEAIKQTEICLIRGQEIKSLVMRIPNLAIKILEAYTEKFEQTENLIEQLGLQDIVQRVAGFLLQLAENKVVGENGEVDLTLSFSKRDLASIIGTTQETLSRKLANFQDEGWIKLIGQRRIIILDQNSLRQIISS